VSTKKSTKSVIIKSVRIETEPEQSVDSPNPLEKIESNLSKKSMAKKEIPIDNNQMEIVLMEDTDD